MARCKGSARAHTARGLREKALLFFFRPERFLRVFHKFFEARITTQKVPHRMQANFSVVEIVGNFQRCVQLLDREIFFAGPSIDLGKFTTNATPSTASLGTGSSSHARLPSRIASSFRPRPASIMPKRLSAAGNSGCSCKTLSTSLRALVKAARALALSPCHRLTTPSQ